MPAPAPGSLAQVTIVVRSWWPGLATGEQACWGPGVYTRVTSLCGRVYTDAVTGATSVAPEPGAQSHRCWGAFAGRSDHGCPRESEELGDLMLNPPEWPSSPLPLPGCTLGSLHQAVRDPCCCESQMWPQETKQALPLQTPWRPVGCVWQAGAAEALAGRPPSWPSPPQPICPREASLGLSLCPAGAEGGREGAA